jgi:hypothetical protein
MSDYTVQVEAEDAYVIVSELLQGPPGPQGPQGSMSDTHQVVASEALQAGDLVNVWSDAGQFRVRRAFAGAGDHRAASGYVVQAFGPTELATVYFEGTNAAMSGLTPGERFLSDVTPGATRATPPSGPGVMVQRVGFAVAATAMNFDAGQEIALAA